MPATIFLGVILVSLLVVPTLAWILRACLPDRAPVSSCRAIEPIAFGVSQKARRSPRHAVLLHRGLMGSFFMAIVALALVPAATALGDLGPRMIPAALAFALPTLVVSLHARRRSLDE